MLRVLGGLKSIRIKNNTKMVKTLYNRTDEEIFNTLTHLSGVVITVFLASLMLRYGYAMGWQYAFGVTFFACGMLLMYSCSTLYHWWLPGAGKRLLRVFDHIGIYVMIAASYTPICVSVVGGWLGWTVFSLLWLVVAGGACYKIKAIGRYPKLSLALYLIMGWSGVLIAGPVFSRLPSAALWLILAEGLFYTFGTYFYSHDGRRFYHGIWHLFVLAGSLCHCGAVFTILEW